MVQFYLKLLHRYTQTIHVYLWLSMVMVEANYILKILGQPFQVKHLYCRKLTINRSCFVFPLLESFHIFLFHFQV